MPEQKPLSPEEREAAFTALCGADTSALRQAANRLSADPTTTERLLALLETQTRPEVRQGVLYALAWHPGLAAWDVAVRVLTDTREAPGVRGQAAEVLAYHFNLVWPGEERFKVAVAELLNALKDPSPEVRYCAVFAIGATAHLPLLPALEAMLGDHAPVPGWVGTVAQYAAEQMDWLQSTHERRLQRLPPYDR